MEVQILSQGTHSPLEFEGAIDAMGLVFIRVTLKQNPYRIHWHIRKPGESGTLEASFLSDQQILRLEWRANRTAPWQAEVIRLLEERFST